MLRDIPNGSVEIQTGLWLYGHDKTIGGTTYTFIELYSAGGLLLLQRRAIRKLRRGW